MVPRLSLLALGTLGLLAAPPQANAGSCCNWCASPCAPAIAPMVAPNAYYYATQFYVVDQGPTYSGPGIVTLPPNYYPYVGNGCCAGQYQAVPQSIGYEQPLLYSQPMPYQQAMPYEGETYEGGYVAPEPTFRYRRVERWHRPVYRRHMVARYAVPRREAPYYPTRRRPFDPRDK